MAQWIRTLAVQVPSSLKPGIAMSIHSPSVMYRHEGQRQEALWGLLDPFVALGSVRDPVSKKQSGR